MLAETKSPDLVEVLDRRGDPLAVCSEVPWLAEFVKVAPDAASPLAMSGPHPDAVGSYGAECIAWARDSFGVTPRWWQALALTRQLEHDADGQLVYPEVIETAPRRSGKSARLRIAAMWRCLRGPDLFGEQQLSMLVSKDLAVGKEIHRGVWRWAEQHSWNVVRLGGAQEVESPAGDRWLLRAPNAAYGYDTGYGQGDEAWGIDPQAITDGLEPALLERRSPQLHLTSTAHVRASSLMRRRLAGALRGDDPNVLLLMWGAHPLADVADEATWRAASPHWTEARRALVARKYLAALAGEQEPEFDDPDPVRGWAAQYLNVWPLLLGTDDSKILQGWAGLATEEIPPMPEALGIAADLDRTWLSLAAYGGDYVGSVVKMRFDGARAEFVAEVARVTDKYGISVAVDKRGPAATVIPDLLEANVDVTECGLDDRIQADADFSEAVTSGALRHGDSFDLNRDVDAATWRKVGDRRLFSRSPMLEAASLARHVARNATYDVDDSYL